MFLESNIEIDDDHTDWIKSKVGACGNTNTPQSFMGWRNFIRVNCGFTDYAEGYLDVLAQWACDYYLGKFV